MNRVPVMHDQKRIESIHNGTSGLSHLSKETGYFGMMDITEQ